MGTAASTEGEESGPMAEKIGDFGLSCPKCGDKDGWDRLRGICWSCQNMQGVILDNPATSSRTITLRDRLRNWLGIGHLWLAIETASQRNHELESRINELQFELSNFRTALKTKASEVFDKPTGDKLMPSGTMRYVPVARRRAAAEQASQGAKTHADEVRVNNQKVFETQ